MFERVVRVPQPPDQSSNAGYPEGAANRGRLFFGYFILAKQKKVTSCRSTTGEVDFVFDVGLREKTANPTYMLEFGVILIRRITLRSSALHNHNPTLNTNPFKYAPSGKLSNTG